MILFQVILEKSKRAKRKDEERREGAAPFKPRSEDLLKDVFLNVVIKTGIGK